MVEGSGRESVLVVWEDRGRGLCLTSEDGYGRALAADEDAAFVGYPRRDIRGLADPSRDLPSARQQPSLRSPTVPPG